MWELEQARWASDEEAQLLRSGWEPFSVVQEEDFCDGICYEVTIIYFRKQSAGQLK